MPDETESIPEPDSAQVPEQEAAPPAQVESQAEEQPQRPPYEVTVEDVGTLRKKLTVTVGRDRIQAKFDEMFGELARSAAVPGFRVGHAPRRLIEKRFGKEVGEDVRNALVGEAMGAVLEQESLDVLGEPEIELEKILLPEEGDLQFSFEVEVAPQFDLPDYEGIEIHRPPVEITDEDVDRALEGLLRSYGRFKPVDSPAAEGDMVVADVSIRGDDIDVEHKNVELRVAPAEIEGIPLEDLGKVLTGLKVGQSAQVKAEVPAGHPREQWRGKEVTFDLTVRDVKRLEAPELTDEFAAQAGFGSVQEVRETARRQLEARAEQNRRRSMRRQVEKYLLEHTSLELPEGITARHTNGLLSRRYVQLLMAGVPQEQIRQNLQTLRERVSSEAVEQLKLSFILEKLAEAEGVEVDDAEVNAHIAEMARRQNRRPERLRQEMRDEGSLDSLRASIREEKAVAKILEKAKIVDDQGPQEQTDSP